MIWVSYMSSSFSGALLKTLSLPLLLVILIPLLLLLLLLLLLCQSALNQPRWDDVTVPFEPHMACHRDHCRKSVCRVGKKISRISHDAAGGTVPSRLVCRLPRITGGLCAAGWAVLRVAWGGVGGGGGGGQ